MGEDGVCALNEAQNEHITAAPNNNNPRTQLLLVTIGPLLATFAHPVREDSRKKLLSAPQGEDEARVLTYIRPHLILRGVIGFVSFRPPHVSGWFPIF